MKRASPAAATRYPLERPDQLRGNPAAVKPAGLWNDGMAVDLALEQRCIECHAFRDRLGTRQWARVAPCRRPKGAAAVDQRPVSGGTFPLTETSAGRFAKKIPGDVTPRQIECRWMRGFEHANGLRGPCDLDSSPADYDLARIGRKTRWARVIPDRFLTRLRNDCKRRAITAAPTPLFSGLFQVALIGHRSTLSRTRICGLDRDGFYRPGLVSPGFANQSVMKPCKLGHFHSERQRDGSIFFDQQYDLVLLVEHLDINGLQVLRSVGRPRVHYA